MTDPARALADTWPPLRSWRDGSLTMRDGAGGGKRVESATCAQMPTHEEIDRAEQRMEADGGRALFALRPEQSALDRALADRGYLVLDPTLWLSAPVERIAGVPDPVTAFTVWPPLQVQRDLWAEGGIGPERVAVMERVETAKTAILGRAEDRPAGAAFVAMSGDCAVVHAVEVRKPARRSGLATHMMRAAARWAEGQGATEIAVLVTEANTGAIALYEGLGLEGTRCYHYRVRP